MQPLGKFTPGVATDAFEWQIDTLSSNSKSIRPKQNKSYNQNGKISGIMEKVWKKCGKTKKGMCFLILHSQKRFLNR